MLRTDVRQTLALPFNEFIGALNALRPDAANEVRRRFTGIFAGAMNFTMPEGLGAVVSRKCYIAVGENETQADIDPVFQQAKQEYIAETQVWRWSTPAYEGHPKATDFYAAKVGTRLFVVTNNRQDFVAAANGLASSAALFDTPAISAPGWRAFSEHNYWAYRAFRHGGTSNTNAAGTSDVTPAIAALTFCADADSGNSTIQVFSSDPGLKNVPKVLPPSATAQMRLVGTGIWQASIRLSNDEETDKTLFQLFYFLGFGVAL